MALRASTLLSSVLVAATALAVGTATGGQAAAQAAAEAFPSKPIRIISPFSAGSPPDVFGRLVAQQMSAALGQNVVVENRPGAGTTLATKAAAMAEPDGYTLVQVNATLNYAPALYPNAGYDPIRSFTPVALLASWTHILAARPDVAAGNLQELVVYAKANPGKLNIGAPLGTPPHVLAHMLRLETGAALNDVPYRQLPQLVADFLGGRLQLYFGSGEPVVSMIRDGRAKAYGSTGATREAALPNVPTMTEAGFPGLTISPSDWTGLLAPAGTPASVVAKLNTAAVEALKAPEIQASVSKLGWTTKGSPQQEFATFVASDAMKWPAIVKAAGLKAE